ncbi:bifunctional riboflavin kinase/FAD synthetase [Thermodesulfobacteriota bacterium]
MELIEKIETITTPYHNAVVTIGNFDGVHIGHHALFQKVIEKARALNGKAIAITFEPHPIRVLKHNGLPPLITLYEQKVELIEKSGLDVLICIHFTPEFADLSAEAFVKDLLLKRIGMKAIVVGEDYTFGKNREGNLELLQGYARRFDFEVIPISQILISNNLSERISSTIIRDLVMEGKVDAAHKLLGRYYQIRGVVVAGRNRGGKQLGFPTANLNLHDELCPKTGIYAVTVDYEGKNYQGVANIGYSPTFDDQVFTVEVHIIDFSGQLYDKNIRINFVGRMRAEKRFDTLFELSEQIKRDIIKARKIISS